MIRNLRKAGRRTAAAKRKSRNREQLRSAPGQFEKLEDRLCLAWVGFFDGITLDLVQTFDDGDVVIDNSGVGGAFRVTDNADTLTFVASQNVTVTMLDNTANQLNFNINNFHNGDATLNLGDGPRDVFFFGGIIPGIANTFGGDVTVNAGDGPQNINLAPNTLFVVPFETFGSATFNLGDGFDFVYNNENFVIVGDDLNLIGVNLFRYTDFLIPPLEADLKVGGDLTMDTSGEDTESFLLEGGTFHDADPAVNMRSIISGDFNYIGGPNIDHVNLNDTYIVGDVNIDLGLGTPFFGNPQNVTTTLTLPLIFGGPTAQIDGDISITAGDSNLGNVLTLDGEFFGRTVDINMGNLVDDVEYSLLGNQADVTASMGGGDDSFTMNSFVNVLDIDWGNDVGDEFINNIGQFTFDADFTNFQWFDHLYNEGNDTLTMNELMDTGNIRIDNDGGPGAFGIDWRLFNGFGGVASSTPASTLNVNMLDNSGDLEMDLFNPVIAFLNLTVGDGDRDINFTGASNNPLRDINIIADQGDQNVQLSANAPLAVATLNVDLGIGFDTVDDNANNLLISEDFVLRGVNHFENDGVLAITRHAAITAGFEAEDTVFANNSFMSVGGLFTYIGSNGRDEVRLNGAAANTFAMTALVDVGDNVNGGTQSILVDNANVVFTQTLTVTSSASLFPDEFIADPGTTFGANLRVNLGGGPNHATIVGAVNGLFLWYDGTSGADTVTLGSTGNLVDVTINTGSGDDTVNVLAGTGIDNGIFDLGPGNDLLDLGGNDLTVNGNLDLIGVNLFSNTGTMTVGGSVSVNNIGETDVSLYENTATMNIGFNFTYDGGSGRDTVLLGGTSIGNIATVHLGANSTGGTQSVVLDGASSVGSTLFVTSNEGANPDSFSSDGGTFLGGDVIVNLGSGPNDAQILGVFGGSDVRYTGGVHADNVIFGTTGSPADVNIKLGGGNDTFTLEAGASISTSTLRVDFGGGTDTFNNNFGAFTFDANLLNWHGYSRFYDVSADSLIMTQVAATGDVTIDNNGTGNAIRLTNGFVTEMTPASDVRLNLLQNSNTDVSVDYDSAQAGDTILDLKRGNREVTFVGDSNQIGGFLRIEAGDGIQNVHLAANADLNVGEALIINLRGNHDTVNEGINNVSVGTNFILRAVNTFEVGNTLNIGGNLTMNTSFDNVSSLLDNNGILNVGGNLNYIGGSGVDNVTIDNGAFIAGNANIDLGTNIVSAAAQNANITAGASVGRLWVSAGSSFGGNNVSTDATTNVAGDVIINLTASNSPNNVTLLGTYGGTYGTYRGGGGTDIVDFGATATNMNFVTRLGTGNDTFVLQNATLLDQLLLDGGPGNDTFIDGIGQPYPFPVTVINFP